MNEPMNPYRPKLSFYHPNPRGTGSAVQMELAPAGNDHPNKDGYIICTFAKQKSLGNGGYCPHFDWDNKVVVMLTFSDLCLMLQVFRGECETINEGRGIFHRSQSANTLIKLEHIVDPCTLYKFSVQRKAVESEEVNEIVIGFSAAEALGLSCAIENSMGVLTFGIPCILRPKN